LYDFFKTLSLVQGLAKKPQIKEFKEDLPYQMGKMKTNANNIFFRKTNSQVLGYNLIFIRRFNGHGHHYKGK